MYQCYLYDLVALSVAPLEPAAGREPTFPFEPFIDDRCCRALAVDTNNGNDNTDHCKHSRSSLYIEIY